VLGDANLYTTWADGTGIRQITHDADGSCRHWPAAGRRTAHVVFHLRGVTRARINQLFIINADGSNVRQLTHSRGHKPNATWGAAQ
jgi:hypothetical protein